MIGLPTLHDPTTQLQQTDLFSVSSDSCCCFIAICTTAYEPITRCPSKPSSHLVDCFLFKICGMFTSCHEGCSQQCTHLGSSWMHVVKCLIAASKFFSANALLPSSFSLAAWTCTTPSNQVCLAVLLCSVPQCYAEICWSHPFAGSCQQQRHIKNHNEVCIINNEDILQ